MSREFWHSDDEEEVLAEFLAEHSFATSLSPDGETFFVGFGDAERLPALDRATCGSCGTGLRLLEDDWKHLAPFRERQGCTEPRPT